MNHYEYQAKATKRFGITFRSKLEAQWAYALSALTEVKWDYVDSDWHDFVIRAPWGDAHLEIKPEGPQFWSDAVLRIPLGASAFVIQGEPLESFDWTVETGAPICCVYHGTPNHYATVSWRCLQIQVLQPMWHGARSYPVMHATLYHKAEIEDMERRRVEMLEQLRSAEAQNNS